jgi:hypothetical protein
MVDEQVLIDSMPSSPMGWEAYMDSIQHLMPGLTCETCGKYPRYPVCPIEEGRARLIEFLRVDEEENRRAVTASSVAAYKTTTAATATGSSASDAPAMLTNADGDTLASLWLGQPPTPRLVPPQNQRSFWANPAQDINLDNYLSTELNDWQEYDAYDMTIYMSNYMYDEDDDALILRFMVETSDQLFGNYGKPHYMSPEQMVECMITQRDLIEGKYRDRDAFRQDIWDEAVSVSSPGDSNLSARLLELKHVMFVAVHHYFMLYEDELIDQVHGQCTQCQNDGSMCDHHVVVNNPELAIEMVNEMRNPSNEMCHERLCQLANQIVFFHTRAPMTMWEKAFIRHNLCKWLGYIAEIHPMLLTRCMTY